MADEDPRILSSDKSATGSIKSDATEQASRLADSVKDEAKRYEKDLRSGVVERAESVAAGLRKAGSEIDPNSSIASLFDRAADSVSDLADSLNATDPSQMLDEVRSFAHRQPGAFLGLSALAGFAAIRFLRAGSSTSSTSRERSRIESDRALKPNPPRDRPPVSQTNSDMQARATAAIDPLTSAGPRPAPEGRGDGGSHA